MAYWAAGWYLNAVTYRHRCMVLLRSIEVASKNVMPQNKSSLKPYLKKECYGKICLMLEGLYIDNLQYHGESGVEYDSLEKFRHELMEAEEKNMKAHLAKPNYDLDSKEAVLAVLGTHRVEISVLPLLFLVLQRHKKIIDFASKLVLEEMEFDAMIECIQNISDVFETRFRNLLESWRQQRLDTKLQIGCFSGGIFEAWHEEFHDAETEPDFNWDYELPDSGGEQDGEYGETERAARAEDALELRAHDILLYEIPHPQPSPEETRMLREQLEARKERKAKKAVKKAERQASFTLSDNGGDTDYDEAFLKAAASPTHKYDSSDEGGSEYGSRTPTRTSTYDFTRPRSSVRGYGEDDSDDENIDYDDPKLWDSDPESDSDNSSDSSASDFVTRKAKNPKLEERMTNLEARLSDVQATLQQILASLRISRIVE